MKVFRIVFALLAFAAFIGICTGAYHQIVTLIICVTMVTCSRNKNREQAVQVSIIQPIKIE